MIDKLLHINYSLFVFLLDNVLNGAILYISMIDKLLHINYSLFVFLLDNVEHGWYITCGVYVKNKVGRTFTPGDR